MNERIRQLAEQACAFADIQYNKQTRATFYTNKSVEEFFREKFAELIVKETMQVVANNLPQNTYLDVADAVIEHFKE